MCSHIFTILAKYGEYGMGLYQLLGLMSMALLFSLPEFEIHLACLLPCKCVFDTEIV